MVNLLQNDTGSSLSFIGTWKTRSGHIAEVQSYDENLGGFTGKVILSDNSQFSQTWDEAGNCRLSHTNDYDLIERISEKYRRN